MKTHCASAGKNNMLKRVDNVALLSFRRALGGPAIDIMV